MASLQLEVVTPDRLIVSREVDYVSVQGTEGELGILPSHVPFLSALKIGNMHYTADGETVHLFISGGFVEVSDNKVSILAESAEDASTIDVERAQKAQERARQRLLEANKDDIDTLRAEQALKRSIVRLNLARK